MHKKACIMQIKAELKNQSLPLGNYQYVLYQFLDFTQNLKRSRQLL